MNLGITGKIALVAGASSGLGFAVAAALAQEGALLSICGRDPQKLARAKKRLESINRQNVFTRALDLGDPGAARKWVDDTVEHYQALHIVITNSSGPPPGPAGAFDDGAFRQALETTTLPAVFIAQAAIPHLRRNGWGRLLFITSETIKQPVERYGLSAFTRLAIAGYAKALVPELGKHNITVNILAPGYHRTEQLEKQFPDKVEEALAGIAGQIPMQRIGRPEDFGAIAAFLAGEQAAFITGSVQLIDGGRTLGF